MSEAFLGEIRIMAFTYPPRGWASCNGQILPINQNQALYALLGTTYGGNGQTNFALPDLRGRVPILYDDYHPQGSAGGAESHVITQAEMPPHNHGVNVTAATGTTNNIASGTKVLAADPAAIYAPGLGNAPVQLAGSTIASFGGSQPHTNLQPFTVLNFCICLASGIYPSQN